MATTCVYHCAACGQHFHSLDSFDTHRVGPHEPTEDERRHCEHPLDLVDDRGTMRLQPLTEAGICRLGDNGDQIGVTVWTERGSVARAAQRFDASVGSAEAA